MSPQAKYNREVRQCPIVKAIEAEKQKERRNKIAKKKHQKKLMLARCQRYRDNNRERYRILTRERVRLHRLKKKALKGA